MNNMNILNSNEKENLNILLGFILRKLGEEDKRKEDQNIPRIKNFNNYDIVYIPQKPVNSQKENEELERLLNK